MDEEIDADMYRNIYSSASSNDFPGLSRLIGQLSHKDGETELSKVCMELELNRVHLEDSIKLILEEKLLSYRFFNKQSPHHTLEKIKQQTYFLSELIDRLDITVDNDELFSNNLVFIVEQIIKLKRILKSTYNVVPWEEMEFSLLSYIRSFEEQNEIFLFTRLLLTKQRIIEYLDCLKINLAKLDLNALNIEEIHTFPPMNRDDIVSSLIHSCPEFESLHHDYELIRDMHSLGIMLKYIEIVKTVNPEDDHAILIFVRALQVIGERLTDSLDHPGMSKAISNYLVIFLNEDIKNLIFKFKNASGSFDESFTLREELLKKKDTKYLASLKNDLVKVGGRMRYILFNLQMIIIVQVSGKLVNLKDDDALKEIIKVVSRCDYKDPTIDELNDVFQNDDLTALSEIIKRKLEHGNVEQPILNALKAFSLLTNFYRIFGNSGMLIENSNIKAHYKKSIYTALTEFLMSIPMEKVKTSFFGLIQLILSVKEKENTKEVDDLLTTFIHSLNHESELGTFENHTKYVDKLSFVPIENKIQEKFTQLREICQGVSFKEFKSNRKIQAIIELLLIDLMHLLEYDDLEQDSFLDFYHPSLTGKNLYNHLVHNDVLSEVLFNSSLSVYLLTRRLLKKGNSKVYPREVFTPNIDYVMDVHTYATKILKMKQYLFSTITKNDLVSLQEATKRADVRSRDIENSTCLHYAMKIEGTIEVIKFLDANRLSARQKNLMKHTPLHIAVKNSSGDVVDFLINNFDLDINDCDNFLRTPVHWAAFYGRKDMLRILLKYNADMFKVDLVCNSPLQYAVLSGKPCCVDFFFEEYIFYKLKEIPGGYTTLHLAAEYGLTEMVQYLIRRKIGVDAKTDMMVTALQCAAMNGHLDVVKALISAGAGVNITNMNGISPLLCACKNGEYEVVKVLLENKANVNCRDSVFALAPIHTAAREGYLNVVKILLDKGANVNMSTKDGYTPVMYALENKHFKVAEELLKLKNIDANVRYPSGMTILHIAAAGGALEIVDLLLKNGNSLNCVDNRGYTPLHSAAENGHEAVVDLLLSKNASIHTKTRVDEYLPLHLAAASGKLEIVRKLLDKGSDVNAKTSDDENCLHIAARNGNSEVLEYLISKGVTVEAKTKEVSETPLHVATTSGCLKNIVALIKAGSDIDAQNCLGFTPLFLSVINSDIEIFKYLLTRKPNLTLRNYQEWTFLILAVRLNRISIVRSYLVSEFYNRDFIFEACVIAVQVNLKEMLELLLHEGAPKILRNFCDSIGNTLLHMACFLGNAGVVKFLLAADISQIKSRNVDGREPLHWAVECGHDRIVEILLRNGASCNSRDKIGLTPLHLIPDGDHDEMIKLLVDNGADMYATDNIGALPVKVAALKGFTNTVRFFVRKDKKLLNWKGINGDTLLHDATVNNQVEVVRFLLDEGADMLSKDKEGLTPVHIAIIKCWTEIIDIFIEKGMTLNKLFLYAVSLESLDIIKYLVEERGYEPNQNRENLKKTLPSEATEKKNPQADKLFSSIKNGDTKSLKELIANGVSLNEIDMNKGSPLHFAVYKGQFDIVKILLKNKVSINSTHKNGWTPLHYACKFDNYKIVLNLLWHGAKYDIPSENGKKPIDFAGNVCIRNLLETIDSCFVDITNGNKTILNKLKKIKDIEVMKAVMRAENTNGATIMVIAYKKNFPDLTKLENIFQPKVEQQLKSVDDFLSQEKYREAKELMLKIHELRSEIFGLNNPATLKIKSNISAITYKLQLYEESLKMSEEICKRLEESLGPEHSILLKEKNNIALLLLRQGKDEASLKIYEEILEIQKKTLKDDDEDYLYTMKHMALPLMAFRKFDKALKIYQHALNVEEKKLGSLHPYTLMVKNNMGLCLRELDRKQEALKLFREAHEGRKLVLGHHHSDTLRTLYNLISVYESLKKYDDAMEGFELLLQKQKEYLGKHHLDTLNTQMSIANLLSKQGKYFAAFKIFKEIKDHKIAVEGPNHSDVLAINHQMQVIMAQYRLFGINNNLDSFIDNLITSMNEAAKRGEIKEIERLMESGVHVSENDKDGRNCLHYAVDANKIEVVKYFFKHGGNLTDKTNKGNTALHTACNKGYREIVEFLLENVKGKKLSNLVNAATNVGRKTALHLASQRGFLDIVKVLLKLGAIYDCVDKDGKKPIDLTSDEEIKQVLNVVDLMFSSVSKKDFSKIAMLQVTSDYFHCIVYAKNSKNQTIITLLLSHGQIELVKQLTNLM